MGLQYLRACIEFIHEMDSRDAALSDSEAGQFDLEAICGLLEIE